MTELAEFRNNLRDLKETILKNNVYTSQDPDVLNNVVEQLKQEFIKLRNIIRQSDAPSDVKRQMMYYLRRDCLMFPFTLDEKRIDELPEKNSMEEVEYGEAT